jgi:Asp-tRNA(Asn)/Glu-tRNA(Gln) amidotransferase C subunit
MDKFLIGKDGHLSRNPDYYKPETDVQGNLKKIRKIVEFIQSLDDEGIEIYIHVAKERGEKIGDENKFRETLLNIRDNK